MTPSKYSRILLKYKVCIFHDTVTVYFWMGAQFAQISVKNKMSDILCVCKRDTTTFLLIATIGSHTNGSKYGAVVGFCEHRVVHIHLLSIYRS